jgi:hypothetical protein
MLQCNNEIEVKITNKYAIFLRCLREGYFIRKSSIRLFETQIESFFSFLLFFFFF